MKIFYDHHIFSYQRYGGVSRYVCELLRNIPQQNWVCSTLFSNNQYIKDYQVFNSIPFFSRLNFKGKERIISYLNYLYSKQKLKNTSWDVFHSTGHAMDTFFDAIKHKPIVVTAHDLLYELYHKEDRRRDLVLDIERRSAIRAHKIIAISQNTKNDLVRYWGIDDKKISVVYHGINKQRLQISDKRIIENPFVLYVGARADYKNFPRFVKTFSVICNKYPDLRLICTGANFTKDECKYLHELAIENKVIHIGATEQQMAQLYSDAEMFVYPSLYEGFGMPILEAMVYDCPAVISNTSCFPEIAQNAALYFDPLAEDDMAEKMMNLLDSQSLKKELIKQSRERLEYFSWQKSAKEHMDVYQSLL